MLIENETKNAKAGKEAYIYIKINNLTDEEIISKLYKAGKCRVLEIRLIVRGMLSLVPGDEGCQCRTSGQSASSTGSWSIQGS
ncbi:MAG: hypothetical protein MZV63_53865 [Marinilabiliales bacterium]|nr:hypothetical protein [Marinilabiliales bacterium]